MQRSLIFRFLRVAASAALALGAGLAHADDSSMSRFTGDSYAYFNHLPYEPGKLLAAIPPRTQPRDAAKAEPKPQDDVARRDARPDFPGVLPASAPHERGA